MVLDFPPIETADEDGERIEAPSIEVEVAEERYGKFVMEPLEPGHGVTVGNTLRRALYNSLQGTAITWVKIEGVVHEYDRMPHVKEEVLEFLLNVKGIRLRSDVNRQGKLRLDVAGEGEVCAADIMAPSDIEVVNPELHLATLDSAEARLSVEFNVQRGKGYVPAGQGAEAVLVKQQEADAPGEKVLLDLGRGNTSAIVSEARDIGQLPLDAVFTPITRVEYHVDKVRVGRRASFANFERLTLEVWTDGCLTPVQAVKEASRALVDQFFLLSNVDRIVESATAAKLRVPAIPAEKYQFPVEQLDLSSRTLNSLKRAGVNVVGEVLERTKNELLEIRNFGEKSYSELMESMITRDLMPQEMEDYYGGTSTGDDGDDFDDDETADEAESIDVEPAAALANGDVPSDDPDADPDTTPAEAEPVSQVE